MESQQSESRIKACKVCFTAYDIKDRRPRVLFCGHTFCSRCITDNLKGKKVACPICRKEHQATSSSDFPVNYELESVLQEDPTSGQLGSEDNCIPFCDVSRGISKKLRSIRQDLSSDIKGLRTKGHEACSQLHQYKSQLMEWKEQHHKNLKCYRGIVHQHEDVITYIHKECLRVDEDIGMGNEETQKMKIAGDNLAQASTTNEVMPALEEADLCYDVLETWTQKVHKNFPDSKLIVQSKKLTERSKSGLLKFSVSLDQEGSVPTAQVLATSQFQDMTSPADENEVSQEDMAKEKGLVVSLEIKEKIQKTLDSVPTDQINQAVQAQTHTSAVLKVQDLVNMTPLAKNLLETKKVYSVKDGKRKEEYDMQDSPSIKIRTFERKSGNMAPSPRNPGVSTHLKDSLKNRIKDKFSRHHATEGGLEIRKLKMFEENKNKMEKVQKLSIGQKSNYPTKVILLVGATGTGKTTLINAMVNFIYGVDFADDFRFILIDDKNAPKRSQAENQTDFITAYVLYQIPGMPFKYNYILIDTPGFGDTRGIQRDREIMKQLETFLNQDYGVDQIDSVGFVTPASAARLTQIQRYAYDGLSSMFGKDIKNNIYIMATFADAKVPPVLEALKEAEVHYTGFYKFNNSVLFAQNGDAAARSSDESDSEDEDHAYISKLFWEIGYRSMNNFFSKLSRTIPVSLTLTKEVLEERSRLQIVLIGLKNQIHLGLGKLTNLNQERDMLSRLDDDMKGSANYKEEVEVPQIVRIDLKSGVMNCIKCNMTCHYPCDIPDDANKAGCWAMTNGNCRICPGKCYWDVHKSMNFRYETTWIKEQRIVQELFDRYNTAQQMKHNKERTIKAIERDINQHAQVLSSMIKDAQGHMERLEAIALKPNPIPTKKYIELMIESEQMQKHHNFEKRIEMLQKLKGEVAVIQGVRGDCNHATGESLLRYFQKHMDN